MRNAILSPTICLLAVTPVFAQPPTSSAPAPTFMIVSKTTPAKGLMFSISYQTVTEQVEVKELVNVNGQVVEVIKNVSRSVYVPVETARDISNSRVITANGKQLPIDEVWKRLRPNTVVVLSGDVNTPAAAFLQALNPETLVIIAAPPKPMPAPK